MAIKLNFWKMHGLGNDYVVIDNREKTFSSNELSKLAVKLCKRRFGVGADGLLAVCNSDVADVKMRMFNVDGTEAEMCGNGIRCFAKYCFENGIIKEKKLLVETLAGIKRVHLKIEGETVNSATVNMGIPSFEADKIPINARDPFINKPIEMEGQVFMATAVSMGNPHCVIFLDKIDSFPVEEIGTKLENHPLFPKRANIEFVEAVSRKRLRVRVWERGVGETLACGTGACASFAVANLLGKVEDRVIVELLGGELNIEYVNGSVLMEGPAEKVFEGIIEV